MTPEEYAPVAIGAIALSSVAFLLSRLFGGGPQEDEETRRKGLESFAASHGFAFHPDATYLLQSRFPPRLRLLGDKRMHARNILLREDKAKGTETAILDFDCRVEVHAHASERDPDRRTYETTEYDTIIGFRVRGRFLDGVATSVKIPPGWSAWTDEEWLFFRSRRVPLAPKKGASLAEAFETLQQLRDEILG
ncbi:MAG TPA: hypothetical protein VMV18_06275 [bacterium]|nr:hypothetical protein [bacterium]